MLDVAISQTNKAVAYLFRVETHIFKCFMRFPDKLSKTEFEVVLVKKLNHWWW